MFKYEQLPTDQAYRDNWDKVFGEADKEASKPTPKIVCNGTHFKWDEDEDTRP